MNDILTIVMGACQSMLYLTRQTWAIAGVIVLALAMATAVPAAEPDAASLVRQAREQEAWIERVHSLQIEAVQHWTRTPEGLEKLRRQAEADFPGSRFETDPNSRPHCKWTIDFAYDRTRVRVRLQDEGYSDDLRLWDGKRFVFQNRYADWPGLRPDQDATLIASKPGTWLSGQGWSYFASFRAGPHSFWWNSPQERADIERMSPRPEDFAYEGQADFHGMTCHVVSHWDSWTSLFIGVGDGRLHGIRSGAQTSRKLKRSLIELYRAVGRQVADEQDMERQASKVTAEERAKVRRLGSARLTQLIDPCFEFQISLYKEIAPGCRIPLVQSTCFFEVDRNGDAFEASSDEMHILKVKVNEPLPDALFAVSFKQGERIEDQTVDPPLSYRYKANITPGEWAAIRAEARTKAQARRDRERARAAQMKRPGR